MTDNQPYYHPSNIHEEEKETEETCIIHNTSTMITSNVLSTSPPSNFNAPRQVRRNDQTRKPSERWKNLGLFLTPLIYKEENT